jgi:hypothetical protein
MVNPKDIPNKMLKTNVVPGSRGHEGAPLGGASLPDKFSGKDSIGTNSRAKNPKSAGHVGNTNVSHS